jgi:hypothetical protein
LKLEVVHDMWQKDSCINDVELGMESLHVAELHGKYLRHLSDERIKLKALKLQQKQLKQTLEDYYRGDLNNPTDLKRIDREPWPKTILRSDLSGYVEGDSEMVRMTAKLDYQDEVVKVLDEIVSAINKRNFLIKNAIDWLKFTNGQ